jgi:hypothetical protein
VLIPNPANSKRDLCADIEIAVLWARAKRLPLSRSAGGFNFDGFLAGTKVDEVRLNDR